MTERYQTVWDAIETDSAAAENLKLRSALMLALSDHMRTAGLSQARAARMMGVTQPRISDLVRGKINLFGLDALVNMAARAGLIVELRIRAVA